MSQAPWKELIEPEDVDIIAPDGSVRCRVAGYYSGKQFVIDDMSADVREGDEIRRMLPNGREEAFVVTDPKCYSSGPFGAHYQVAVSRRGIYERHSGGNYNITLSGANSRVNVASTDQSMNTAVGGDLFNNLRKVLDDEVADLDERAKLLALVEGIKAAPKVF